MLSACLYSRARARSRCDMAQVNGCIMTFYSYKGGTGRSMALANFAWMLAASGKRVLAIDWDLEAPGLHRYFRPFLADPDLFETDGLIDMFWDLTVSASRTADRSGPANSAYPEIGSVSAASGWNALLAGPTPFSGAAMPVRKGTDRLAPTSQNDYAVVEALEDATRRLDSRIGDKSFFPPGGYLDFIGAGRQGPTYSERVNILDW